MKHAMIFPESNIVKFGMLKKRLGYDKNINKNQKRVPLDFIRLNSFIFICFSLN